jgi:hypothetical protein
MRAARAPPPRRRVLALQRRRALAVSSKPKITHQLPDAPSRRPPHRQPVVVADARAPHALSRVRGAAASVRRRPRPRPPATLTLIFWGTRTPFRLAACARRGGRSSPRARRWKDNDHSPRRARARAAIHAVRAAIARPAQAKLTGLWGIRRNAGSRAHRGARTSSLTHVALLLLGRRAADECVGSSKRNRKKCRRCATTSCRGAASAPPAASRTRALARRAATARRPRTAAATGACARAATKSARVRRQVPQFHRAARPMP